MTNFSIFHNYKYNNKPKLHTVADAVLTPCRYAFGRKIIHVDAKGIGTTRDFTPKNFKEKFFRAIKKITAITFAILTSSLQLLFLIIKANTESRLPEAPDKKKLVDINFDRKTFQKLKPKALKEFLHKDFSPATFRKNGGELVTHLKKELGTLHKKETTIKEEPYITFEKIASEKQKRLPSIYLYYPSNAGPTTKKIIFIIADYFSLLYNQEAQVRSYSSSLENLEAKAIEKGIGSLKRDEVFDKRKIAENFPQLINMRKNRVFLAFTTENFPEKNEKNPTPVDTPEGGFVPLPRLLEKFEDVNKISNTVRYALSNSLKALEQTDLPKPMSFHDDKAKICYSTGTDLLHYFTRMSEFYEKFRERYSLPLSEGDANPAYWKNRKNALNKS